MNLLASCLVAIVNWHCRRDLIKSSYSALESVHCVELWDYPPLFEPWASASQQVGDAGTSPILLKAGKTLHGGSGQFRPEMQKRALENKKEPPENCHRLQCKSLFNVADLVNGMWKVAPRFFLGLFESDGGFKPPPLLSGIRTMTESFSFKLASKQFFFFL